MTKQEFIEQAVLRLITETYLDFDEVVHRASEVASLMYDDEAVSEDATAGKDYENESLAALIREVDRLDILNNKNSKVKKRGYAKTFARVCASWDINTIKDLLKVGSYRLKDARSMGATNLAIVSEALYSLYGIDKW